mgnify:CR=1 FL=1
MLSVPVIEQDILLLEPSLASAASSLKFNVHVVPTPGSVINWTYIALTVMASHKTCLIASVGLTVKIGQVNCVYVA